MNYTWEEVLEAADNAEMYETENFEYAVVGFTSTGKKIPLGIISWDAVEKDNEVLVYFLRAVKQMAINKIKERTDECYDY